MFRLHGGPPTTTESSKRRRPAPGIEEDSCYNPCTRRLRTAQTGSRSKRKKPRLLVDVMTSRVELHVVLEYLANAGKAKRTYLGNGRRKTQTCVSPASKPFSDQALATLPLAPNKSRQWMLLGPLRAWTRMPGLEHQPAQQVRPWKASAMARSSTRCSAACFAEPTKDIILPKMHFL